jgi:hypothetical protein
MEKGALMKEKQTLIKKTTTNKAEVSNEDKEASTGRNSGAREIEINNTNLEKQQLLNSDFF